MASFYEELQKSDSINDEKENIESRANVDKWIFRLFLILIGVMPLIVMADIVEVVSPLTSNLDILTSGLKGELFTSYKALFLLVFTLVIALLFLIKVFFMNGSIQKTFLNYVLGTFVVMILISTLLSPNISIALNGQYNRSDGAITWLCYITLLFIALNIEYPKNIVRSIMYITLPFVFINLYIITMNFFGKDILQKTWMQKLVTLMLPEGANLSEGSTLIGTLNHGNYMSGMFAIMALMYFVWAVLEKKTINKSIGIVAAIASMFIIFMALSTSGFLTVVCITPFLLWIIFKSEKKIVSAVLLGIFLTSSGTGLHILAKENSKVWDETFGFFVSSNPYVEETLQQVSNKNNTQNPLEMILENKVYASEQAVEIPELPQSGVGAGSGRLYIWTYILDLVKERPIQGYGLDSLMYNFQHYNIDARANLETEAVIVDKPHNMYIGVLYGTGIVGFIAFMVLVLASTWASIKQIIKPKAQNVLITVLAVGALAFFFQAIFNDSLPGINGVMWVVLGILLVNFKFNSEVNQELGVRK